MTRPRRRASDAAASRSHPRITNTPAGGSRAGPGQFPHLPHPGGRASSTSRISTVAARPPPAGADAGGTVGAVVVVVVTTVVAVASRRGSAATTTLRDGSPDVAALPATCGTLDKRRLVGTDASDLSALAGASAVTVGATLQTRKQKTKLHPLETGTSGVWAGLTVRCPQSPSTRKSELSGSHQRFTRK
jgi:hypothetical protein